MPRGGVFLCGDYWVSAARSADTSVETYTLAPPRGSHRHYARLAIGTFPADAHDCRTPWPPACGGCCTINVAPGESIQAAIDALPDEGGCVCLKTGVHDSDATIVIASSRIVLRGESPGAVVRSAGLARSLQIGGGNAAISDIVVEGIRFEATAAAPELGTLIYLEHCAEVAIRHCVLAVTPAATGLGAPSYVGVQLSDVAGVRLTANRMSNVEIGIASGDYHGELAIIDNAIEGYTLRIFGQLDGSGGHVGIRIDSEHSGDCRIEGNRLRHGWSGVRVDDCNDACIDGNSAREVMFAVLLNEGERNRVTGTRIEQTAIGISCTQEADLQVSGNLVQSGVLAGMLLFVRGAAALTANRVLGGGFATAVSVGIGIFAEELLAPVGAHARLDGCEVIDTGISADGSVLTTANAVGIGNRLAGCQLTGNRVGYTQPAKLDAAKEHRALLLSGPLAMHIATGAAVIEYMSGSALVSDNHFRGPGRSHLVEFLRIVLTDNLDFRFENVTFSNNICDHLGAEVSDLSASVALWGGHLIAVGNHVKGPANVNAMSLANRNKVALMGNVTSGDYINVNAAAVIPTPIANFNVRL